MVKRHNPRPPSRRRLPPMPAVSSALPTSAEMVAAPVERPDLADVSSESQDTATSHHEPSAAESLLGEVASDPEAVPPAAEPLEIEPALSAQDLDVVAPALVALQPPPDVDDVPFVAASQVRKLAPYVSTDVAAAGATLQAFILNESLAALAHWRALSKSQSPAEALRLHVDEMQRAADASLTCMGRLVGHLGRIGARNAA